MYLVDVTNLLELAPPIKNPLIAHFAIDSRSVQAGSLFFALRGEKVHGHAFLQEVAQRGAVAAVVEEQWSGPDYGMALLRTKDTRKLLQELARRYRMRQRSKVIGITGSLGKTTAKEFTVCLLKGSYSVSANPGTHNSQVTLPLAILNSDPHADLLVLEMGMTHKGEIANLVSIAPPEIALVTSIAYSHACNFSNGQEGIAQAKAEIFSHPQTCFGLYNVDTPFSELIAAVGPCPKVAFSTRGLNHPFAMRHAKGYCYFYEKGAFVGTIEWKLPGLHLLPNFLAAYSIARTLQVPYSVIKERAQHFRLPPMRLQRVEREGIVFINDAYNASSPDAVLGALQSLPAPVPGGRKIAVLGSMRELGPYTEEAHLLVAESVFNSVEDLFCLGPECASICNYWKEKGRDVELYIKREDLVMRLKGVLRPGDVVLLKGSRSLSMDLIVEEWAR